MRMCQRVHAMPLLTRLSVSRADCVADGRRLVLQNQPDVHDADLIDREIGALSRALGEPLAEMSTGWQPFSAAADRSDSMVSVRTH
jgi:hypothetical protein